MSNSQQLGIAAEREALSYLRLQGLKLLCQNFHSRFGEIDLIMLDQSVTVFVEVKHRQSGLSAASESINYAKQQKLVKAAQYYLLKSGGIDVACRFDVVLLDGCGQKQWLKNVIIL